MTDGQSNTYSYNNGNQLLSYDAVTFEYDANGNMTSKTDVSGTTLYIFDSENRLIRIDFPDSSFAEYRYDPFGRRIEKNVNGVVTRYIYDKEDILLEYDGSGNITTEYLHGPVVDEPMAIVRDEQTYYYHTNVLGSITSLTDSNENIVQRYEYDSFGNITYQQYPNFIQPYTYTGREYDSGSGLYFYRARYYDARIGRFISEDPIRFEGGINFYVYVGNSPVNFLDNYGLGHPYRCDMLRMNCELECGNKCEDSEDELEICALWCKIIGMQYCLRCPGRGKYPDNPYCQDKQNEKKKLQ